MSTDMRKVKQPVINDRKIKVSLVGCGRISQKHFEAIKEHKDDLELDSICDINQEALDRAMHSTSCPGYTSLSDMLANSNSDLVTICTPHGIHFEQVCQVAASGRHVITEKPMATKWTDAVEMVEKCENAGIRLFVVKQNRMNATLQMLKLALQKNRFGKIYLINVNVLWFRPQDYYDLDKWRGSKSHNDGALMNQASHYIDLLYWLFGPVESIQAMNATLGRNIEVEDTSVLNVKFKSGALASLNVTMLAFPKNFEGSITILGEKGTVRIGGQAVNKIEHWEFQDQLPEDQDIQNVNYVPSSVYGLGHGLYYKNVIQVLRGEAKAEVDGREGLRSLEIIIAAYKSAKTGEKIFLPLRD
jgi:UDP-N-acetyl-2-amino-2-deoxyglucuronate dehydrogenase